MSDIILGIFYALFGATIGLITLPIFSGDGKKPQISDSGFAYVMGCALLWPLYLASILWLFIQWYRCYWAKYLIQRNEIKKLGIEKDFQERWEGITEDNKIKYDYEKRKALHLADIENLNKKIVNHRFFLEIQARKGYWDYGS